VVDARPGQQLPTTRSLVEQHGASPVTIQKALRTLIAEGFVETRVGVGAFVRAPAVVRSVDFGWQTSALGLGQSTRHRLSTALRSAPSDAIALHAGYPEEGLLPHRLVSAALSRAARGAGAVARAPVAGLPELQAWFANELSDDAGGGGRCSPNDVIILPGSQSGLSALFRTLAGPGVPVVMESPTYWGAILAAEQVGARIIPIPTTARGPDPDELSRVFGRTGARLFYAQPTFANPTGGKWDRRRADEILGVVRRHGAFLVEDDWAHDFAINGGPFPLVGRDEAGQIIYLRSLTKSVSPSIRVAAMIARGPVRDRLLADLQAQAMYVSAVLQHAALDVVTQPAWQTHLRRLRHKLEVRRDLMIQAVRQHLPYAAIDTVPSGGLNIWVRLPDELDLTRLVAECEQLGVVVAAGSEWFPAEPTGNFLRLNFSGPEPERFDEGVRLVAEAIGHQQPGLAGAWLSCNVSGPPSVVTSLGGNTTGAGE